MSDQGVARHAGGVVCGGRVTVGVTVRVTMRVTECAGRSTFEQAITRSRYEAGVRGLPVCCPPRFKCVNVGERYGLGHARRAKCTRRADSLAYVHLLIPAPPHDLHHSVFVNTRMIIYHTESSNRPSLVLVHEDALHGHRRVTNHEEMPHTEEREKTGGGGGSRAYLCVAARVVAQSTQARLGTERTHRFPRRS